MTWRASIAKGSRSTTPIRWNPVDTCLSRPATGTSRSQVGTGTSLRFREKFAPSKEGLSRVKVQIQVDGGNVSIRTVRPTGMSTGSYGAEYHIHVPKSISL